jgi:hypothetical protein
VNADAYHRPALGSHRLLGQGRGAALIDPAGTIDWWCPEHMDAPPLLWSLLDGEGASSRWVGARIAAWDERPAGPTAHTTVRIGGCRVELWDGLVRFGDGTALIRLVRAAHDGYPVEHRLRLGGFDTSAPPDIAT